MKKFRQLFNERAANCVSSKGAQGVLLDIQFNGDMVHIVISQRQFAEFVRKLKGDTKKKVQISLID